MLTLSKMKKIFLAAGLIFAFSATQAVADEDEDSDVCMFLSPICMFRTIIKASPAMPVHDFISTPAMIRHVPAALSKEGQLQLKQTADADLRNIRSGQSPSTVQIPFVSPGYDGVVSASKEEYMSLEPFPVKDSEDPKEIAKAIEVIFLRPGWQDKKSVFTDFDKKVLEYYHGQFLLNNTVEIMGFGAYMQNKLDDMLVSADRIQKQIETANDLNKVQRANYAAQLMEYELMIIQNQIQAATMQAGIAKELQGMMLEEPIFSGM